MIFVDFLKDCICNASEGSEFGVQYHHFGCKVEKTRMTELIDLTMRIINFPGEVEEEEDDNYGDDDNNNNSMEDNNNNTEDEEKMMDKEYSFFKVYSPEVDSDASEDDEPDPIFRPVYVLFHVKEDHCAGMALISPAT